MGEYFEIQIAGNVIIDMLIREYGYDVVEEYISRYAQFAADDLTKRKLQNYIKKTRHSQL